jgi:ketosteroid isomerase-like protein
MAPGDTEVARRFLDALNARDEDLLLTLVTDDVEFKTHHGESLTGLDATLPLVKTGAAADLHYAREGPEQVREEGDRTLVSMPVRIFIGRDHLRGTAEFTVRDGKVASFEVVSEE